MASIFDKNMGLRIAKAQNGKKVEHLAVEVAHSGTPLFSQHEMDSKQPSRDTTAYVPEFKTSARTMKAIWVNAI